MKEEWRDILGYEGCYQVSNLGRVRSLARKYAGTRVMKTRKASNGYENLMLSKHNTQEVFSVHRLVARVFLSQYSPQLTVNHINGKKDDNRASNLEWCSQQENIQHAWRNHLSNQTGENNNNSKLTKKQVLEIRKKYIPRKYHIGILATEYNVSRKTIHCVLQGKTWGSVIC